VDAIVVGAGVIGAAVALELGRLGYAVTVVDRASAPGHGSTGASSAIVRYHYAHRDEVVTAWESHRRWLDWERYLGVRDPAGMAAFIQCGLVLIDGGMLNITTSLHHLKDLGIPVERLDARMLRERFPEISPARLGPPTRPGDERFWAPPDGEVDAYWIPDAGYIDDPQLAAHNLAHAAASAGARFRFNTEVTGVLRGDGRVTGLTVAGGEALNAPVVVNAAGPWSGTLNRLAGVLDDFTTSTRPLEQEVISLPAPGKFHPGHGGVCVADTDFGTYYRPHAGQTLIVGGMEGARRCAQARTPQQDAAPRRVQHSAGRRIRTGEHRREQPAVAAGRISTRSPPRASARLFPAHGKSASRRSATT
jgi:sarcosine oxidase, subunit beta